VAQELRKWRGHVGTGTLYIEPGSPRENGYCEHFNGKLRDECWNGEIFYSLKEAQVVIEQWRLEYNTCQGRIRHGFDNAFALLEPMDDWDCFGRLDSFALLQVEDGVIAKQN
jgi:integrase-like protein